VLLPTSFPAHSASLLLPSLFLLPTSFIPCAPDYLLNRLFCFLPFTSPLSASYLLPPMRSWLYLLSPLFCFPSPASLIPSPKSLRPLHIPCGILLSNYRVSILLLPFPELSFHPFSSFPSSFFQFLFIYTCSYILPLATVVRIKSSSCLASVLMARTFLFNFAESTQNDPGLHERLT
jgi:hypothetical protein